VADALRGGRSRNRRVSLEDLLDRTQSEMEAAGEDVTAHWNDTIAGWRRQAELARVSGNERRALQYEKRIAELEDLLGGGGRKVVRPGEEDLFFQAAEEAAPAIKNTPIMRRVAGGEYTDESGVIKIMQSDYEGSGGMRWHVLLDVDSNIPGVPTPSFHTLREAQEYLASGEYLDDIASAIEPYVRTGDTARIGLPEEFVTHYGFTKTAPEVAEGAPKWTPLGKHPDGAAYGQYTRLDIGDTRYDIRVPVESGEKVEVVSEYANASGEFTGMMERRSIIGEFDSLDDAKRFVESRVRAVSGVEVAEEAPVAAKGAAEVESIFTPAVENVPEHIRELTREVRTLARQLGADVKKSSNLRRAKNAYLEYDKALKDAAARLQGLYNDFDPEFVRNGLREMNLFTDEQIEDAIKAAEKLREDYVATLGKRRMAGLDAKEFLPGAERGYIPSRPPLPRTEKEELAEAARLKQIGVPEDLRELEKVSSPWQQATMTPKAQGTKQYPTPLHATEGKSLDELLRAEKGIVSPFAEEAPQGVAREFNAPALLERKLQEDARAIEYKKFTDQIMQLIPDEKEAQKLIGATKSLFTDDPSTKGLLKVLDTFTNFWKRQATIFRFPGFQSRNMITNKILMAQDGALSLGGEQRSFDLLKRAYAKKPTEDDIALVEDLIRNGVLTSFEEVSEQIAGKAGSRVTRFLGKTNEIIENQSRISAYLTYKAKGYAPAVAGDMVNTSLFNYSDEVLSTFEANFIRRLVPFYKWMKSNVSKQTRLLVTMPGAVTWVGHLKEAGESVTDYDKENIPKWLRDLYPIPLPITDSKTGEPIMLSTAGLFPQGDLEILSGLLNLKYDPKDFFGTLTPILRTPLEILFNKDLWYDSEIERYKGEKKRLPAGLEKTADAMSQVEGLSDVWAFVAKRLAIEEIQDDNGDYYWNAPGKALKVLRDMSPWFNQVNKLLDVQAKTPYDVTMAVTGVKPILVEEERFAKQKAYEERAELQDLIQRLKDEGRMGDARETATTSLAQVFGGGLGGTNRR